MLAANGMCGLDCLLVPCMISPFLEDGARLSPLISAVVLCQLLPHTQKSARNPRRCRCATAEPLRTAVEPGVEDDVAGIGLEGADVGIYSKAARETRAALIVMRAGGSGCVVADVDGRAAAEQLVCHRRAAVSAQRSEQGTGADEAATGWQRGAGSRRENQVVGAGGGDRVRPGCCRPEIAGR